MKRATKAKPVTAVVSIERAMLERDLLGAGFGDPKTWQQWRIVLKATFGIKLSREEAKAFTAIAGGRQPPAQKVRELWCVLGRRSGKSRVAAALAVYFAVLVDHTGKLAPGEIGYVFVLAASKDQARTIKNYCEGFLRAPPVLASSIVEVTAEEIRLRGGIVIGVHSANYRTVRGRSLLAVIFDEVSFWRSEESAEC
jgi:phage terminase large subunit-like protein